MSFDLFHLPQLASMIIINTMNISEQFLTSLCSRRAFSVIKSLRQKSEGITMSVIDDYIVLKKETELLFIYQFVAKEDSRRKEIVTVNGHSTLINYDSEEGRINTFWQEEQVVGTMELVEYVNNLFGIHVDTLTINNDSGTRFMNWVQRRQRPLRIVEVNHFAAEELKNIIMACEADSIQLNTPSSPPFEIQNLNKRCEVFFSRHGTWMNLDNLMTLDCVRITVLEKLFTCTEMNIFIKHWLNGGSPRLKTLQVPVADHNWEIVHLLRGLDVRYNVEKLLFLNEYGFALNLFEVVRSDGITAGFNCSPHRFWFGVWPRDTDNILHLKFAL
uniref:FBA_2 domain-containing protein n=1 Tax=Caenorhabditis tropicalis TaxID=1561998 RepID=A0A1I7TR20_9PELO